MSEFNQKQERIRAFLTERKLRALLLQRVSSFAWATCGASSYINTASSNGEAMLVITPTACHLISNNIEAPRLEKEEGLVEQGWEFHVTPWYEAHEVVKSLAGKGRLAADVPYPGAVDLSPAIARLRVDLSPEEGERFRNLGHRCAQAMDRAIRAIKPGQSEFEIAAIVAKEAQSRGMQAIVNLVASDERVYQFRHPLPTDKKIDRYVMIVLCGRRWGLVCSITRLVYFGSLPDELRKKTEAAAKIDAIFIGSTRPDEMLGEVFQKAVNAYAETGYPEEWKLHHQGGPAGYEPREFVATPVSKERVKEGQVYAWNPSIAGTKLEDSILIGKAGNEVLTRIDDWPVLTMEVDGKTYNRPSILEVQ